jgi:hypothetical protein
VENHSTDDFLRALMIVPDGISNDDVKYSGCLYGMRPYGAEMRWFGMM